MKAFHRLLGVDREWALDHSQRLYRVRKTWPGDREGGAPHSQPCITITRLSDGHRLVVMERCAQSPEPVTDTDDYAEFRFAIVNWSRTARGEAEG